MVMLCTPETVIKILHEKVGVPPNTPGINTASWEELGVESLGLSETCASLEQLFDITLPHEKALHTANIPELVELVNTVCQQSGQVKVS